MYRRALSSTEIKSIASGEAVSSGLSLSYDFDEAEGSTVAEASGSSMKLARAQSGLVTVPGTSGSAIELDGGAGYVQLPPNLLDGVSDFTVACFVNRKQVRSGARVFVGGAEVGSRVVPGLPSPLSTTSNWLGRSHRADALLNAALDDFRVYDRALSGPEIAVLASSRE
jgi:hypothetical protein